MHNYTLDTNNNIEKHLQQIQNIKSRLIRNNFLTEESLYQILNELVPNFNRNAINYINSDIVITLSGWNQENIQNLIKNVFLKIIDKTPIGTLNADEILMITNNPEFFASIQQINFNIYIIRI